MNRHYHILSLILALLFLAGCSLSKKEGWVKSDSAEIRLWISEVDTTLTYRWIGESFDSVAHGQGDLLIMSGDSILETRHVTAFYGAFVDEDIAIVSADEKYVGELDGDKFEGYGAYSKGNDLYIGHFQNGIPNGFLSWYKNGELYYVGTWKDGRFHGDGTLYKEDGTVKTGEWDNGKLTQTFVDVDLNCGHYKGYVKNSKPDGIGQMTYADGSKYSGKWKTGAFEGEGVYIAGTDTIVGNWEKGKINGDVIYQTEKYFYEGTMLDNYPTGIGNLTVVNHSFYTGNWIDGKRAGIGDIYFINGDSYSGEWEDNQFSGVGKYIYENIRASYEGEWLDGLQNGNGYYRSPEFAYRGEWEKGWMDGEGTLVFKNGDKYEGSIHENLIDGIGTYTFKNGNFYEGEFVEGQMTGLGIFHFKNGTTFEGEFQNGKIYGDGTLNLVENGKVVSITGFWPIDGKFPKEASILFPSGDLYEGPICDGFPTNEGTWTSAKERNEALDKVENSALHKANEFYKRNKETFDWCLMGASIVVTAIEIASASTVVLAPIAGVAQILNMGINAVDAGMAIASATVDASEAYELGEDTSESLNNLIEEVALNTAFIFVPKTAKDLKKLGKPLKNIVRSSAAKLGIKTAGKFILKKSAIKFVKSRIYGKAFKLSISTQNGVRKIEKVFYRNKITRKPTVSVQRLLTGIKHQAVPINSYMQKLKQNPELAEKLALSAEGNSKNLGNNMRLFGTDKWVYRNERIRRYLDLPKRQVEPHHIIPSNPVTPEGKAARKIWTDLFGSVDHPCNGIWLGRNNKNIGYFGLAKGSNHSPNSIEYEREVAKRIIDAAKRIPAKYANNPQMRQQLLAEVVDGLKRDLYKGKLSIGKGSHEVHTVLSIFKQPNGVAQKAASSLLNLQLTPIH